MKLSQNLGLLAVVAAAALLATPSAKAQNANFATGDLTMFFWNSSTSTTLLVNLGAATTFRDATENMINFTDLNSLLTTNFGNSWYDTTTLRFGLAATNSNDPFDTNIYNGDAARTVYLSKARTAVGTVGTANSNAPSVSTDGSMTTLSGKVLQMNDRLETQSTTSSLVEPTSTSLIDNNNPTSGATYQVISSGGTQAAFTSGSWGNYAGIAAERALDLYRMAPTGSGVTGTYEGTFVIDNLGQVSYVVPEPSTYALMIVGLGATLFFMRRKRLNA